MTQYNRLSILMDKKLYETMPAGGQLELIVICSYDWVVSGVPHQSVLGPLLFLIMMTNTDEAIMTATVGSFAYNTRLCQVIDAIQGN